MEYPRIPVSYKIGPRGLRWTSGQLPKQRLVPHVADYHNRGVAGLKQQGV